MLLKLDSSLNARKQLARRSAAPGLHKQVMMKLAEGSGVVPDSLQ